MSNTDTMDTLYGAAFIALVVSAVCVYSRTLLSEGKLILIHETPRLYGLTLLQTSATTSIDDLCA